MADTDTKIPNCGWLRGGLYDLICRREESMELAGFFGKDFTTTCREGVLKIRRKLANIQTFRKDAARTNERGIPYAPFVDRVEDYVTTRADVEPTLKRFQEMI
ncbi:hypothetical protein BOTCAL_0019g00330 [Botryotinia calthae]|uniref:Uncharacterized protein n=1 Tax=Botryotinia calthae TaxID=38488 RepID=A0A4Y8DF47_9HELO|nr:hypothetical protein BOTCAL_0019g00330 [Botryotinia calthae]